ncbi:MAG: hypothetical protein IPG93_09020 [Burkholderiales bacterium]|nr:hypothetical protein [Burkholderiales bacterium]
MQAQTQHIALSQQTLGTPASRDHKSDRAFAVTLAAMLLAVLALPFAGGAEPSNLTDTPAESAQRVVEQSAQPATATLETVVITGRRSLKQAQATASTPARRS